jgi:hypothetical protein
MRCCPRCCPRYAFPISQSGARREPLLWVVIEGAAACDNTEVGLEDRDWYREEPSKGRGRTVGAARTFNDSLGVHGAIGATCSVSRSRLASRRSSGSQRSIEQRSRQLLIRACRKSDQPVLKASSWALRRHSSPPSIRS